MFKLENFILLSFIINSSLVAQVKIEEEVKLNPIFGIESESLITRFYGSARGCVNWGAIWGGGLKEIQILTGDMQLIIKGFGCGSGYLDCNWNTDILVKGKSIDIQVFGTCVNGQLIASSTRIINVTGNTEYRIEYLDQWGYWTLATTLQFIPIEPPECQFSCGNQLLDSQMPQTSVMHVSPLDSIPNPCEKPTEIGFFTPVNGVRSTNIDDFTFNDIDVCFDRQTSEWKFDLYPQFVFLNVVKVICTENTNNKLYFHKNEINSLNCYELKQSIKGHKTYPLYDEIGSPIYYFAEIIYAHEDLHEIDWIEYKNKWLQKYLEIPKQIIHNCGDFSSKDNAKTVILKEIQTLFFQSFWTPLLNDYLYSEFLNTTDNDYLNNLIKKEHRELEKIHHRSLEILSLIKEYENYINQICN